LLFSSTSIAAHPSERPGGGCPAEDRTRFADEALTVFGLNFLDPVKAGRDEEGCTLRLSLYGGFQVGLWRDELIGPGRLLGLPETGLTAKSGEQKSREERKDRFLGEHAATEHSE
jgi:hypothetical protein